MSDQVLTALIWLKGILESQKIQYQIVGGLAAAIHGGHREVEDIDLFIRNKDVEKLLLEVSPYLSKPLIHYSEYGWDLKYFQLIYAGQKIEIGLVPNIKIQSAQNGAWYDLEIDVLSSVHAHYKGLEVSVIRVDELVKYKRILGREVDLIDIRELMPSISAGYNE